MLGKILSFPIRLILFIVVGLLSAVILLLNRTVIMICAIASQIVKVLGVLACSLIEIGMLMTYIRPALETTSITTKDIILFSALMLLGIAFFYFLPKLIEKIYIWAEIAGGWLWCAAKAIIFWDKSYFYVL